MTSDPRCTCGHARRTHWRIQLADGTSAYHGRCRLCTHCERFDRVRSVPTPPVVRTVATADEVLELEHLRAEEARLRATLARLEAHSEHLRDAAEHQSRAIDALLKAMQSLLAVTSRVPDHPDFR